MPNVVRVGDKNESGGEVLAGSQKGVFKGRGVARVGDPVSCPKHGDNRIAQGNQKMLDEGRPVAEDGRLCECGCRLIASLRNSGSR
jgi:uncharacterized Zn-binding protein involved in type VI secretion